MFILRRSNCIVTASGIVTLRITSKVSQKAENFLASSATTSFKRKSVFHEFTETIRDRTILLLTSDAVREISRRKVDVDCRQNNGIKAT
jgi:tRNA C32,U32 (ribose-2'-O)-methylase TrmJ